MLSSLQNFKKMYKWCWIDCGVHRSHRDWKLPLHIFGNPDEAKQTSFTWNLLCFPLFKSTVSRGVMITDQWGIIHTTPTWVISVISGEFGVVNVYQSDPIKPARLFISVYTTTCVDTHWEKVNKYIMLFLFHSPLKITNFALCTEFICIHILNKDTRQLVWDSIALLLSELLLFSFWHQTYSL